MKQLLRSCTLALTLSTLTPLAQAAEYILNASNWGTASNPAFTAPDENGNTITVNGVTDASADVCGARITSGNDTTAIANNVVNINDSELSMIYGALTSGKGTATNNHVTISEGSTVVTAYGANVSSSNAENNHITIDGESTVSDDVFGATSGSGALSGNTATIKGGSTVSGYVYSALTSTGTLTDNHVTIEGGSTVERGVEGAVTSGTEATGNSVTIKGADTIVNGDVNGAKSFAGGSTKTTLSGNSVTIADGATVNADVRGAYNSTTATDNHVTIKNATVTGDVYGGYYAQTATDNHVTIENATVTGAVYAGYVTYGGKATNNNITLKGTECDLTAATLYGNYISNSSSKGTSGILTLQDFKGSVKSIQNFDTINFVLSNWETGATLLTLTAGSSLAKSYTLNVDLAAWNATLGDKMTLISGLSAVSDDMTNYSLTGDAADFFELQHVQNASGTWDLVAVASKSSSESGGTAAVPEPTTATLSLLALAGLAARRRRK